MNVWSHWRISPAHCEWSCSVVVLTGADCPICSVRGNHDDSSLHRWRAWSGEGKELKPQHAWVKDLQPRHVEALEALPFTLTLPDYGITVVGSTLNEGMTRRVIITSRGMEVDDV